MIDRYQIELFKPIISYILMYQPGLWSRSRWSPMFSAGVGVGFQNCWSRIFKTAVVGVGFSKLLESEHLLQLPTPMFIK